jgi:Serine/Threonine/Tyrosine Kinase found in polyvalent proteins
MHESNSNRDKRDAPRPLGKLRARLQDDAGRGSGTSFRERLRMETESAMEWERSCGGNESYPADLFETAREIPGGNEHRVFQTSDGTRAIKVTNPPGYGAEGDLIAYLNNLVLNNFLHGDDLQVEFFQQTQAGLQLVISQPWIEGVPAQEVEISRFMAGRGFEMVRPYYWHSAETGIRVFDARPANVFKESVSGILIPIDVHIKVPESILEEAWCEQLIKEAEGSYEA